MRFIRLVFVILLAIVLIGIALANREMVSLSVLPANLGAYLGVDWVLTMPLFLLVFGAMLVGMVLGLIWEWLRESHLRAESKRRAFEISKLEREVGQIRQQHRAPKDDVLAILDGNKSPGAALPARR